MALTIVEKKGEVTGNKVIADRRLYLDAKGKIVGEGPKARVLYCAEGKPFVREDAEKRGLKIKQPKAEEPKADGGKKEADAGKAEDKADGKAEDKSDGKAAEGKSKTKKEG